MREKIGIVLDNVIRDLSTKVLSTYKMRFPDREVIEDYNPFKPLGGLQFDSPEEMTTFYEDNFLPMFGRPELVYRDAVIDFNHMVKYFNSVDVDVALLVKDVNYMTRPATFFFLADKGIEVGEVIFYKNFQTLYEQNNFAAVLSADPEEIKDDVIDVVIFDHPLNKGVADGDEVTFATLKDFTEFAKNANLEETATSVETTNRDGVQLSIDFNQNII